MATRKYIIGVVAVLLSLFVAAALLLESTPTLSFTRPKFQTTSRLESNDNTSTVSLDLTATCGGKALDTPRAQWAATLHKYAHLRDDKFTIAMQTYQRPEQLKSTLEALTSETIPSLHEIVVVWNEIDKEPPKDYTSTHGVRIRYRVSERNSLNMKLLPDPAYQTQAILLHDDDVYYEPGDLEFVFQTWRQFGKHRIVGGLPRCAEREGQRVKYTFCPEDSDSYSMILSNLAFIHISFLDFYSSDSHYATFIRNRVDEAFNCEDIGLNYITSALTCTGALQAVGRKDYISLHPDGGISSGSHHLETRSDCMKDFEDLFGMSLVEQTGRIVRGVKRLGG